MAFTGTHVFCCAAGGDSAGQDRYSAPVYRKPQWSETMASPGTTQNGAPSDRPYLFRIEAAADIWGAVGKSPDASQAVGSTGSTARFRVKANEPFDIYVDPGDKFAWILIP